MMPRVKDSYAFVEYYFPVCLGVHVCSVCEVTGVLPGMHDSLVSMHLMFFRVEGSTYTMCVSRVCLSVAYV